MRRRVCLDTGPLQLYYLKDCPNKVESLFQDIKNETIDAIVPEAILIEVFKHLCVSGGKDYASDVINSIYNEITVQIVPLTRTVVLAAGRLKCQYRDVLSYNDAIVIATALHERAEVHTTEKEWPKIPKLEVMKYKF
ncbi:MAG TPA: PIN domain-containing protein [Candidatus Lokiarchaeia archaeon]|nr:PIN domain-containing protein [Candidatus Lokiarchaeia archaeon]